MGRVLREDLKRRVREANDIADVVGGVVQLKRAGKSYKALCPFHNEKTPSFIVNTERQTFKCFGCGEGGDVFTFVEKHERVDFKEALAILAERAGIPLEYSEESREAAERAKERKLLIYRAQGIAARFFAETLARPEGRAAREYLKRRGLEASAADWGAGFAPDRWDGLVGKYATSPPKERLFVAAGLARQRDSGGVYDVFRNRITFPIRDTQGRVVGFGGRALGEEEPKYLNTPETAVFSKGRLLYGLERAREEVAKTGEAIVVEGYTDVMRCHEHGFTNAVATLGTALGPEHLRLLRRMGATRVLIVYDADAAGVRAAERGLEVLFEEDVSGAVVRLEGGLDPCDFIAERGAEAFREGVSRAEDAFEFKLAQVLAGRDLGDVHSRAEAARELMDAASRSRDPVKRALYRQRVAERLDVPEETLRFARAPGSGGRSAEAPGLSSLPVGEEALDRRAERELAALVVGFPAGVEIAGEETALEGFEDPVAREVVKAAREAAETGNFDGRAVLDRLSHSATAFAVDALEANEGADRERLAERVRKAAVAVWLRRARARMEKLTADVRTAEKDGDEERREALSRERAALRKEMFGRRARSDPDTRRRLAARKG